MDVKRDHCVSKETAVHRTNSVIQRADTVMLHPRLFSNGHDGERILPRLALALSHQERAVRATIIVSCASVKRKRGIKKLLDEH
jgi:hypothetical protein